MRRLEFIIDGEPVPQGSMNGIPYRKKGKKNKWGVNQVYQNAPEIRRFRKETKKSITPFHDDFFVDDNEIGYIVEAIFYTTKPKSVSRPFPTVKGTGDIDKFFRALLDALTYSDTKNKVGLFKDDAQVVRVIGTKLYTDHENPEPKTKVRITKILLSNIENELKEFTDTVSDVFKGKD
jgi:Holliday junction resolvase RusA-like endonuclease